MTSEEDIARFRNAALSLAGAEKTVMKEVASGMRAVSRPVVARIRAEAKASKGSTERGIHASAVERQLHSLSRSGRGQKKPLTARQVASAGRRAEAMSSLRNAIAAAASAQVSASDKKTALTFKVKASAMPPSQRKLPRRWDLPGGWRHPVFGNRNLWVKQTGHPYFRTTVTSARAQVTAGVITAMTTAAEKIAHSDGGTK